MILFVIGNTGAGKTTAVKNMLELFDEDESPIWLDGDMVRWVWPGLGFSKEDRIENNMRVARLAKVLDDQGFNVIISMICPYRELRDKIRNLLGSSVEFIFLSGGKEPSEMYPYEPRQEDEGLKEGEGDEVY
jgi:adenylylsulfate kinase